MSPDSSLDSPESVYPVAIVVLVCAVLALLVAFAVVAICQRWPRGNGILRTAPALTLIVILTASTALVGRDQVAQRVGVIVVVAVIVIVCAVGVFRWRSSQIHFDPGPDSRIFSQLPPRLGM